MKQNQNVHEGSQQNKKKKNTPVTLLEGVPFLCKRLLGIGVREGFIKELEAWHCLSTQ